MAPRKTGAWAFHVAPLLGCLPTLAFFLVTTHAPAIVPISRAAVAWIAAGAMVLIGFVCGLLGVLHDRVMHRHRHYEDYREAYFRMTWQRNGIYRELHRWKAAAEALGAGRRAVPTSLCAVREAKRQRARVRVVGRQPEALAS